MKMYIKLTICVLALADHESKWKIVDWPLNSILYVTQCSYSVVV